MISLLHHLWQTTLCAAAAGLLVLVLRRNSARTRYWIWFVASEKFLIPFSLLVAAGSRIEWRPAQTIAAPVVSAPLEQVLTAPTVMLAAPESGFAPNYTTSGLLDSY